MREDFLVVSMFVYLFCFRGVASRLAVTLFRSTAAMIVVCCLVFGSAVLPMSRWVCCFLPELKCRAWGFGSVDGYMWVLGS